MFVTQYFVYVHVPKTGGNFVRKVAERHFDIVWTSAIGDDPRQHVPYSSVPSEYAELPAISFVRNPWSHYVSHWAWILEHGEKSRMAKIARQGFKEFVTVGIETRGGYWRSIADITHGSEVGRYEDLSGELLSFFRRHDVPVTDQLERDLTSSPRINASEHADYQKYYDDETRELVARTDRELIEAHGYTFD